MRVVLTLLVLALAPAAGVLGQSSSLFLQEQAAKAVAAAASTQPASNGAIRADAGAAVANGTHRNSVLARSSLTAITPAEPRLIKVNDFIGVIIRYRLRHESTSKLKQDDKWDVDSRLSAWFRIHDRKLVEQDFERGTPEAVFNNKNKLDNKGEANRKDIFEARVMAQVIDIKPNGNLVIVAWSRMRMDDEMQYLRMSGECNKQDIGADGSILSDKIYGLDVETMNEGAVKDAVKRGWFKELTDVVKPF
jgi:flagellar basal body L-ring protein FlgH